MKLRTAIKICRNVFEWPRYSTTGRMIMGRPPTYTCDRAWRAKRLCRRKWRDHRFPFIPSDERLRDQALFGVSVLAGCVIDDPDELDRFREQLFSPDP